MKRKILLTIICFFICFIQTGCQKTLPSSKYISTGTKLNTVVSITLYGCGSQKTADNALDLCDYYEKIFSRTREDSLLYRLNKDGSMEIDSPESKILADLINIGVKYGKLTDGSLDITIEPVSSMWSFGNDDEHVPIDEEIENALTTVDYSRIQITDTKINLNGTRIDLGAIAKGYIGDCIKEYLISEGVTSAIISLGGNVVTIGSKPDESDFVIGIQRPFSDGNDVIAATRIIGKSVVTSGTYERCFYEDGIFYHHILNPHNGYPERNNLLSVTIISDNSVDGDSLSTGCFVLGLTEGMKLINSLDGIYAIFVDENYELHYSEGTEKFIK